MIILGINYFFHDTSACIVKDGELLCVLEEERFTRDKHTWDFPQSAIKQCFEMTGISPADVDHVAVSINPTKDMSKKLLYAGKLANRSLPFVKHEFLRTWSRQREFRTWLNETWPDGPPPVHNVDHHRAHVVGSYLVSPYSKAALLSMDGSGEWSTTWLGEIDEGRVNCYSESLFPHSLGSFYEAATQFCGFRPNHDEGKTMGLAPFGDAAIFADKMGELVKIEPSGKVKIDLSYFAYQNAGSNRLGDKYLDTFGPARTDGPIEAHHKNVAAAAQQVLEDRVLEMCRILEDRSTADYLVIAGGVSLNSVMNGRILRDTRFKDLYVMPAAGDNGTCIGAAYHVYNLELGQPRNYVHNNPFLGTAYSDEVIEKALQSCKLHYEKVDDICAEAARRIHEGEILGWFQGRMEIGPRALGARSILADPTRIDMKDKINAEVKHREAFRPFAPSAISGSHRKYFDIGVDAPFMLKVCPVREQYRHRLPAITHVDGTARLQTVSADTNPLYYRLIREFGDISGIPVVLNTSFNVMGEPIVESPLQAIRCFFSTGLDSLAIGNFMVSKNLSVAREQIVPSPVAVQA